MCMCIVDGFQEKASLKHVLFFNSSRIFHQLFLMFKPLKVLIRNYQFEAVVLKMGVWIVDISISQ